MSAEVFGPYRLVSLLGRGGMGEVWRAVDTRTDREVALKVLGAWLNGDEEFARRFRREAALAAKITAPHVVRVHDFGEIDGRLFIDMPLIEGTDLGAFLQLHGPLPPMRAVKIIVQLATALDAAHGAGLVHRDVKPSNVLISHRGGDEHSYLIDFGIARAVDGTKISLTGALIGTPAYMAPERFEGDGDHRGDVYALGCVLYEALTGRPPFKATSLWAYVKAHHDTPPPRPSFSQPGVPASLDDVVARSMAKAPNDRFPSAGALATAARAALVEGSAVTVAMVPPTSASDARARLSGAPLGSAPGWIDLDQHGTVPAVPAGGRTRMRLVILSVVTFVVIAVTAIAVRIAAQPEAPVAGPEGPASSAAAAAPREPMVVAIIPYVAQPTADHGQALQVYQEVAVSPDGTTLYVSDTISEAVAVIDLGRNSISATIPVGGGPVGVAVAPDGRTAYVATAYADGGDAAAVAVVDTTSNAVVGTIPVGLRPFGIAVSPDGQTVLVANDASDTVSVISASRRTVSVELPIGLFPSAVVFAVDGARAYAASLDSGTLSVIDTTSAAVVDTIDVGPSPAGIAVAPDGRSAYVTNEQSDTIAVVDVATAAVTTSIRSGNGPTGIGITPNGRHLYVANSGDATVSVIDTATMAVVTTLQVGQLPTGIAVARDGSRVYVSDAVALTVSVIDTGMA